METYKVKIRETYSYVVEVEANGSTEAFNKVKKIYKDDYEKDEYTFVADATTLEKIDYCLIK